MYKVNAAQNITMYMRCTSWISYQTIAELRVPTFKLPTKRIATDVKLRINKAWQAAICHWFHAKSESIVGQHTTAVKMGHTFGVFNSYFTI